MRLQFAHRAKEAGATPDPEIVSEISQSRAVNCAQPQHPINPDRPYETLSCCNAADRLQSPRIRATTGICFQSNRGSQRTLLFDPLSRIIN